MIVVWYNVGICYRFCEGCEVVVCVRVRSGVVFCEFCKVDGGVGLFIYFEILCWGCGVRD